MARPAEIRTVLLDTSCLLGIIKGEPDMACLKSLLAAVQAGSIRLVESTAILTEVLPQHRNDDAKHAKNRASILSLLESPAVDLIDVSTVVARKAGQFRSQLGMKTWDAIHLATAIVAGVDLAISRDAQFPYETSVEGVWVTKPFDIDDDKLFP